MRRIFSAMNVRQQMLARHPAPVILVELIQYTMAKHLGKQQSRRLGKQADGFSMAELKKSRIIIVTVSIQICSYTHGTISFLNLPQLNQ